MDKRNQSDVSKLLRMEGIHKTFPGVYALRNVSLDLHAGEVLALLGENGAGKSTLIKVLGGAHRPDEGSVFISGEPADLSSPAASQRAGVSIIYQEFNLVPDLTVRENIFLGRELTRGGLIDAGEEHRQAGELFKRIGIDIDPAARCRDLTVAQQQTVEIAKALSVNARIIVMDEPSAALTQQEVDHLFEIIRELKSQGIGVIYISHRLDEIYEIADRLMILRDGAPVGERLVADTSREDLIEMMVA
jgi:ribose transport system ATP-binding protein